MTTEKVERRLAAILSADVVGYSGLMEADETGTLAALQALRRDLIDPEIAMHQGRIVKLMGDGTLVEFASVVDAVSCAAAIQRAMVARATSAQAATRIQLRIGINLGDVIVAGDDIYGDGVNVAARLEGLAEPDGFCISHAVFEQVRGRVAFEWQDLGERQLKNITQPARVYRAILKDAAGAAMPVPGGIELSPSVHGKPTIAVLPFDNLSSDPEQDYLADGIAGDIITALSRMHGILVISRNSSFTYEGRKIDVRQIARELGVGYVVEGSVRRAGSRVRVTAELVDAESDKQLWANSFDETLDDVFRLQDEITKMIVSSVEPELARAVSGRLKSEPGRKLDAWGQFVRGRTAAWNWTHASLAEAEAHAREAVRLDPDYAEGHALLALVRWGQAASGFARPGAVAMTEAAERARRAVALDRNSAHGHAALSIVLLHNRQFDEAIAEAERAIDLQPSSSEILFMGSFARLYGGKEKDAIALAEASARLNPRDPQIYGRYQVIATAEFALGRYEDALAHAQWVMRVLPEWAEAGTIAIASLVELGREDEARRVFEQARRIIDTYSPRYVGRRHPFRDPSITERLVRNVARATEPGNRA